MHNPIKLLSSLVLALGVAGAAHAETVKVGVIGPFSGPYAVFGKQIREGVEAYLKAHEGSAAGHKVEVVYRDLDVPNPPNARAIAQELIIKDKVQYIGGTVFTPNALTVAPLADEAKVPFVIFNAAKTGLTAKFPYTLRTSYNFAQVTYPAADYTLEQGRKKVVTLVQAYSAGIDAETVFKTRFEAGGGKVVESIRVPMNVTDFTPFVQKAKALAPDSIYVFMGGGMPSYGFIKSYAESGLAKAGIRFIGTGETDETNLQTLGDAALGIETSLNYSAAHGSPKNQEFLEHLRQVNPQAIANVVTASAYDGMHVIFEMIKATGGKRDGAKALEAVRGLAWESPRGPVSLEPETGDIIQNVYIRKVERNAQGLLENVEFRQFDKQPTYANE